MTQKGIQRAGFRWSEIFIYAAIGLGSLGLAISSSAQARPMRYAIEAVQVARAMEVASLPTDGVEIKLAAPVVSFVEGAAIKVETVTTVGPHAVRMRLACREHVECMPFFAMATFPDAVDVSRLRGVKASPFANTQSASFASKANALETPVKDASVSDVSSVRAGSHANLEFGDDKIHIRLEVICLQGGAAGEHVRVSSLDHKQVYVAEVITPTLLKGELSK